MLILMQWISEGKAIPRENKEKVNGKSVAKAYDYDLSGNRIEMKVDVAGNIALDVSYQYDAAGRLIQVFSDDKEIVTYTYDEDGSIASETKSDTGVTTTYQYNYQGMVTDMKNKTSAGNELSSFTCTYDLNGRKVSEEDSIQTAKNKKQNTTKKYAYDQLNRLIKESQTGQDDISYQYDANNNRTGKIQGDYETAYQYNKNNELMRVDILNRKTEKNDTVIYRYDANGNQVASNPRKAPKGKSPYVSLDVTLGSNKENENVVNHYNAKNELIRTLTKDKSVTYEYNADGLRTKKKNHDDVTYYIWDGDQLVLELDKDVKVTKRYLRGNSLITTDNGKEETTTYVTNPHGDVVQLLDKSGKVTKTYDYDGFGNEINPDEKDENPIRYAGEYFDVETGTQYLRARYYAPELGRFITRDTYTGEDADSLSLHLYTYCSNEPVGQVDPSGHNAIWLNSSSSAHGFGHAAVLIQNSSNKWDYLTYTDKGLTKKTLLYYFTFANKNSIINFINKNYRKGKKMEIYDGAIYFYGKFKSVKNSTIKKIKRKTVSIVVLAII